MEAIREGWAQHSLPLTSVLTKAESDEAGRAGYATNWKSIEKVQRLPVLGWKVSHVSPVGLASHKKSTDLATFERRFSLLMRPCNMFLVPKNFAGIGELKSVIDIITGRRPGHNHGG